MNVAAVALASASGACSFTHDFGDLLFSLWAPQFLVLSCFLRRCACSLPLVACLQIVFVLLFSRVFENGFGPCCATRDQKNWLLCSLTFVVVDWCSVGANSGYTRGYQTILHAACLVRRLNTLL